MFFYLHFHFTKESFDPLIFQIQKHVIHVNVDVKQKNYFPENDFYFKIMTWTRRLK